MKTSRQQHANGCRLRCESRARQRCSTLHTCHSGRAKLDAAFDSCSRGGGGGAGYSPASAHNSRLNQPRPCQRLSSLLAKRSIQSDLSRVILLPHTFTCAAVVHNRASWNANVVVEELSCSATNWSASCNHPGRVFHADEQICIRWF